MGDVVKHPAVRETPQVVLERLRLEQPEAVLVVAELAERTVVDWSRADLKTIIYLKHCLDVALFDLTRDEEP